ncbi:uncharacterized protein LOC142986338 isoform X2 [Anticarsia gemmatalis]|uniref:uncharacterized protein LOC142986338 isoform X2 n=1 Tax=Anticarsia gemmatalis TaxID=129554 RepID=UPI003F76EC7F
MMGSNKKPEDLNKSEDIRRVIEKVETTDSVDVEDMHTKMNEISEEKAALRAKAKGSASIFQRKSPLGLLIADKDERSGTNVLQKRSNEPADDDVNPYLKVDNVTAFID